MILNCTRLCQRVSQIQRRAGTHTRTGTFNLNSHSQKNCSNLTRRSHTYTHRTIPTAAPPPPPQPIALRPGQKGGYVLHSCYRSRMYLPGHCIRRGLAQVPKQLPSNAKTGAKPSIPLKMAKSQYGRLLALVKSEKWTLTLGIACLVVSSAITMSVPFFLGKVVDVVFNKAGLDSAVMDKLRDYSLALFGIFIIGGIANFARVYLFGTASLRIVRLLRHRLYRSMLLQEVGWFDTKGTGELVNRLSNDTNMVGISLSQNVSDGLRAVAMVGAGTGMMIYTSPQLALVSALVVPAMAGMAIVYGRYVRSITRQELDKYADIMKFAEERFGNIKTVKTFCREQHELAGFDDKLNEALQIGYKETRARSIFFGLTGFSGNFIIISVLYYGGTLVLNNALTIGDLTSFLLYAGYVAISINGLSTFYTQLNKGIGASERIWEIYDRKCSIPIDEGVVPLTRPLGEVTFSSVNFTFPSRAESQILNDFSLTVRPGRMTALVGRSGSGKSTIALLLMRLYDPQTGSVTLDGVDLRELNPQWLRNQVGTVSQEPVLFSGTIRDNILYGVNPGEVATEELLQRVIHESNVSQFVGQLPDGLDTLVGQRGMMLSGGQKQRVAIARALIKNPTILILDEATSALDSVSEQIVQNALEKVSQGRTVLTIAHRLSTIRNADQIAVLDGGRIVEQGSYDELMQRPQGIFRELVHSQTFERHSGSQS
ncbi:ATP-binding cassette sub-family B member 10, mitochondrial isoform X1 [Drosophila tropicalis]|uniref:ATP-binding cassette sub-family B member 10, mitochondrial isoform X1 n=2 Tax=Drosophila tropicalis TaxID=46794 RepID=UPI0035ABB10D